jgi:putative FmdB family regulatory protein
MPLYEYVCLKCGRTFETLKPMTAVAGLVACTSCNSGDVRRCWSLFNVGTPSSSRQEHKPPEDEPRAIGDQAFPGLTISGSRFADADTGLSTNGMDVRLKNPGFHHTKKDIFARNAKIDIEGDFQSD